VPIYNLSSFRFVAVKRRPNNNYRLFAPKRRQDDKSKSRQDDKIKRKDDKHISLISDLICRLFAWRFVLLTSFRLEKTTKRQNDNCRLFAPKRRQNKKSTIRQNTTANLRFVIFSSRQDDKSLRLSRACAMQGTVP
jgi:hypothetical protein